MKTFNKKKGFTIVELVIVVAVIGVLTAVLVPTFVNLVNKANEAADVSLVKNLNTALRMSENEQGRKNNYLSEAIDDVYDAGYVLENLTPRGSKDIVWNQDKDEFSLLSEAPTTEAYKFWKIYNSYSAINNTYSAFLNQDDYDGEVNVTVGFDCGKNFGVGKVTYTKVAGTPKNDVRIRTAGPNAKLVVDANTDTLTHYGFATVVTVESINIASYHEAGTVGTLTAKEGHIVVEDTAIVLDVKAPEGGESTATFDNDNGGVVVHAEAGTVEDTEIDNDTLGIGSRAQLEAFRDATNSGQSFKGMTITLTADIDLISAWKPISNYSRNHLESSECFFAGTFDGGNHTISGLTNKGLKASELNTGANDTTIRDSEEYTYGLFACVKDATIKNLKLTNVDIRDIRVQVPGTTNKLLMGDAVGGLAGFYYEGIKTGEGDTLAGKISNVKVSGSVAANDDVAGLVGLVRPEQKIDAVRPLTIENCENAASVTSVRRAAGLVGQACAKINFNGNVNSGRIASTANEPVDADKNKANLDYHIAGGIATLGSTTYTTIVFTGNTNSGSVTTAMEGAPAGSIAAYFSPTRVGVNTNGTYVNNPSVKSWTPAN